jgi:hypothetical protein
VVQALVIVLVDSNMAVEVLLAVEMIRWIWGWLVIDGAMVEVIIVGQWQGWLGNTIAIEYHPPTAPPIH